MRSIRLIVALLLFVALPSRGVASLSLLPAATGAAEGEDAGETDAMASAQVSGVLFDEQVSPRPAFRASARLVRETAIARTRTRPGFAPCAARRVVHRPARARSDDPPRRDS